VRSCNHCCSRIAVSMTYSDWGSVALGTQHGMRMRHIILLSVTSLAVPYLPIFSLIWNDYCTRFIENKCIFILSTNLSKTFQSTNNSANYYHKCTHVSTTSAHFSCQIVMKLEFSRKIFEKFSNIKFQEDPSCRSRVVPRGRTDG